MSAPDVDAPRNAAQDDSQAPRGAEGANSPRPTINNVHIRTVNRNNSVLSIQDRMFHTLFYRLTLAYTRACPRPVRRIIEALVLVKAILCFLMLVYVHLSFAGRPVQCLEDVKSTWPRDGILRVEIIRNAPDDYTLEQSYDKERRLHLRNRHRQQDALALVFSSSSDDIDDELGDIEGFISASSKGNSQGKVESDGVSQDRGENQQPPTAEEFGRLEEALGRSDNGSVGIDVQRGPDSVTIGLSSNKTVGLVPAIGASNSNNDDEKPLDLFSYASRLDDLNNVTDEASVRDEASQDDETFDDSELDYERLHSIMWPESEDEYIVEYSLEYGFLRLSPSTRQKLNLTVKLVVIDPVTNSCFGDSFSQMILQGFLGYDDVLMTSIKSLAESEDSRGYLRNVVTGAHYHFVSRWTSSTSYVVAAFVMIIFTVSISMLLRYSQHQIFVFIVELLQMLEFNTNITFPIAPLLIVILALVGMEAIMSEFFEDTTTAFYIIIIVWVADQYDALCCHTAITKRYWLRFFYLYHLSFYAYHYRFSGQYSGLALLTMWFFTQHSMIYFFHHYELPVILQQAQIEDLLMRNQPDGSPPRAIRITAAPRVNRRHAMDAAVASNDNGNNDNNNNVIRPRMRGFSIGGLRFRFGIVFPNNNRPRRVQNQDQFWQQEQRQEPPARNGQGNDDLGSQRQVPGQLSRADRNPSDNHGQEGESFAGLGQEQEQQRRSAPAAVVDDSAIEGGVAPDEPGTDTPSDNRMDKDSDEADSARMCDNLDSLEVSEIRQELVGHSQELREIQSELNDLSQTLRQMGRDGEEVSDDHNASPS